MNYLEKLHAEINTLEPNEDIIVLSGGHSLILGHRPKNISLDQVGNKLSMEQQSIESFGLFDNATPNYTTYYPEVTAEDLNPKDSEFIFPVFRMLSMVTVHKNVDPISFAKPGVLKSSMAKLVGKTVNVDHETAIGNAVGSVLDVQWQNEYKTADGITVPAGINATLKIDGKSNPRLARGIMMSPPSIHSNSVTVRFKWEQSHPNMSSDEFRAKRGTYDEKGMLIQRVATEIIGYSETSLVGQGADPFAQLLNGKEINDANRAKDLYSLSADGKKIPKHFFSINYKDDCVSLSADTSIPEIPNNTNNSQFKNQYPMKEWLLKLAQATNFTFEGDEPQQEALMAHVQEINDKVNILSASNTDLTTKLGEKETEIENLKSQLPKEGDVKLIEVGTAHLAKVKEEAKKLYSLAKGDKANETILSSIEAMDFETAQAFLAEYQTQAEELHPVTCKKCGSSDVSRNSSSTKDEGNTGSKKDDNKHEVVIKSNREVREAFENQTGGSFVNKIK